MKFSDYMEKAAYGTGRHNVPYGVAHQVARRNAAVNTAAGPAPEQRRYRIGPELTARLASIRKELPPQGWLGRILGW